MCLHSESLSSDLKVSIAMNMNFITINTFKSNFFVKEPINTLLTFFKLFRYCIHIITDKVL